jgi:hypothetical protein
MKDKIESKLEKASPKKKFEWITLRFILAIALFFLTLFIFVTIADQIVLDHKNHFDQSISTFVFSLVSPGLTQVMEKITFFGSAQFLIPAYLTLILFLRRRDVRAV